MLLFSDFRSALDDLGLDQKPAIVHASLKAFGAIKGGAETVLRALLESTPAVVMPAFTYKTMVTPLVGPPRNAITYGTHTDLNHTAVPFRPHMPADPLMGVLAETLRNHPLARRSSHPILSFAGINAEAALDAQTLFNPFAPIGVLAEGEGWVLLLGVDHTVNTSIHYAEKLAGRRQFLRWALTPQRIVECPGFPGCSEGFEAIVPEVQADTRQVEINGAVIRAVPLKRLIEVVVARIKINPLTLLCQREDCLRCNEIRAMT